MRSAEKTLARIVCCAEFVCFFSRSLVSCVPTVHCTFSAKHLGECVKPPIGMGKKHPKNLSLIPIETHPTTTGEPRGGKRGEFPIRGAISTRRKKLRCNFSARLLPPEYKFRVYDEAFNAPAETHTRNLSNLFYSWHCLCFGARFSLSHFSAPSSFDRFSLKSKPFLADLNSA